MTSACWHVLMPGRVAVLDAGFAERIRPWPQILLALLRRAGKRASDLDVQRAIASQPRLEVRLALLLWHLAARWGKVEPGGIRLPGDWSFHRPPRGELTLFDFGAISLAVQFPVATTPAALIELAGRLAEPAPLTEAAHFFRRPKSSGHSLPRV